jgi:hypothetical protein
LLIFTTHNWLVWNDLPSLCCGLLLLAVSGRFRCYKFAYTRRASPCLAPASFDVTERFVGNRRRNLLNPVIGLGELHPRGLVTCFVLARTSVLAPGWSFD